MASDTLSIAVFTALGTIVGYLGAEVACDSVFARLLWPNRFYNTTNWRSRLAMAMLMPLGGPIHAAAIATLDSFAESGLYSGYCRGDMLGTAFFEDTNLSYTTDDGDIPTVPREARNFLWARVMKLTSWPKSPINARNVSVKVDDENARRNIVTLRAQRPVWSLHLERLPHNIDLSQVPLLDGDIGTIKFRHILNLFISESITLIFGIAIAGIWRSYFALWFTGPISIKLLAAFAQVRREPLNIPDRDGISDLAIYQICDASNGILLIHGSNDVLFPFSHHYGHPERYRRGLRGGRAAELFSILAVILCACLFPAGIIAFVFAPQEVQWIWLGYELYAMLSMHVYRFNGGRTIGTSEEQMARFLAEGKLRFVDGSGQGVVAELSGKLVNNVSEARSEAKYWIEKITADHRRMQIGGEAPPGRST